MRRAREPVRLCDAARAEDEPLAIAIRRLRTEQGSAEQVAALTARVSARLAASGAPLRVPNGALWKFAVPLVAFAAVLALRDAPAFAPRAQIARPPLLDAAAVPVGPARTRDKSDPDRTAEPADLRTLQSGAAGATARERVAPSRPHPRAIKLSGQSELALLQSCQGALQSGDPARALVLTEQHAREYPQGQFAQEREMLAIEVLLKLHRRAPALARAKRFITTYPTSPHRFRLDAFLANHAGLR